MRQYLYAVREESENDRKMAGKAFRLLNGIYGLVLGTFVFAAVLFAGYSIWDNSQVYRAARNVQTQIRQLKPETESDGVHGFDELTNVNNDVFSWLTVDGTNIDYPVLQGENNLTYMNKDVYGQFSLAGSIFLDSRNSSDLSDNYILIYGHNMDEHLMFGDLSLFKDKQFFAENTSATLLVPEGKIEMSVAAVLQISAGTEEIFNPNMWAESLNGLGDYLKQNSIWYHTEWIEKLTKKPGSVQITALVTCSDGSTNDRTVLILIREVPEHTDNKTDDPDKEITVYPEHDTMSGEPSESSDTMQNYHKDDKEPEHNEKENDITGNGPKPTGDTQDPGFWYRVIAVTVLFIIIYETAERFVRNRREDWYDID